MSRPNPLYTASTALRQSLRLRSDLDLHVKWLGTQCLAQWLRSTQEIIDGIGADAYLAQQKYSDRFFDGAEVMEARSIESPQGLVAYADELRKKYGHAGTTRLLVHVSDEATQVQLYHASF